LIEIRLAHARQKLRVLCDVKRRFAGEHEGIAVALLPDDQRLDQFARCPPVADEIVVNEVDRVHAAVFANRIEFAGELRG